MPSRLTDAGLTKLQRSLSDAEKRYVEDDVVPGLSVRVSRKSMSYSYRYRVNGRRKRVTLASGNVGRELDLPSARKAAKEIVKQVAAGNDPAREKHERRSAPTVGELADEYVKHIATRKRSWKADERRLKIDIKPVIGTLLVRDVKRSDVRAVVKRIVSRGAPVVSNRVLSLLGTFFEYAIAEELIEENPARRIAPQDETDRDRVLTHAEIRSFWTATAAMPLAMRTFWRLRLWTAARGGEVSDMKWAELDLDAEVWTIPGSRAKNGQALRLPLSPAVLDALAHLLQRAHKNDVYVFGAHARREGAGARGKRQQAEAAATFKLDDFEGHDLRRTVSTLMQAIGISREVIDRVQNHKIAGVSGVYQRHTYEVEMRQALYRWADELARIVGEASSTVVSFPSASAV